MSLPRIDGFDPSGWHLHQSIMDSRSGRNVFSVSGNTDGISTVGRRYVEGLLARARDYCLLSVPTVNGYRRLRPDFSLSPTRIGASFEDRSVMVRVLGGGGSSTHVENRLGEPAANPYLTIASQLSAGLEGMASASGAMPSASGAMPSAVATVPQSLAEALDAFRDGGAAELLGKPLALCLAKLKESEVARFEAWRARHEPPEAEVTEWEQREYFETY
jgi:glutamine synthetase